MSDDSEERPEMSLVMPFVNVTSKGGRYDDDAFAAGWEMGDLDARLKYEQAPIYVLTIREANTEQADLIAMQHGYQAKTKPTGIGEWLYLTLTREVDVRTVGES